MLTVLSHSLTCCGVVTSCSLWDRVIGGSCMVLVYVAVAVLLSFKRKILGFTSAKQLQYFLNDVSCFVTTCNA